MFRCSKSGYCRYCKWWCNKYDCDLNEIEKKVNPIELYESCPEYAYGCTECEDFQLVLSKECKKCSYFYDDKNVDWDAIWGDSGRTTSI